MAKPFAFICLNPRKTKRAIIAELLTPLGPVRWKHLVGLRLRGWPETQAQSQAALESARTVPAAGLKRRLKLGLLKAQYNSARALFERNPDAVAVAWNGLNGTRRVFMEAARDAGARTLFFELGPFPGRITADPAGVNFVNSLPRDAAPYQKWLATQTIDPNGWKALGVHIRQRTPDTPPKSDPNLPPLSDPFIFAPLQVPGDSQLRLFGGDFRTVETFVSALITAAQNLPNGWHLRLKEHPSTPPMVAALLAKTNAPVFLDNSTDTFAQVKASRGVITTNSSVGLEAMFFDKPVTACGNCFWAIPGVADHAPDQTSLNTAFAKADTWTFDPNTRNALLSFLDQVYYPKITRCPTVSAPKTSSQLIANRLQGPDPLGFWHPTPRGSL